MVDAATAELGSGAAASSVRDLAEQATSYWTGAAMAAGARGLEAKLSPAPAAGPTGRDNTAEAWDWITRALSALPGDVPCLPSLSSLANLVQGMSRDEALSFAVALDSAASSAGFAGLRIRWFDGLSGSRGDGLVSELLPNLLEACPHLCGDVRCGDGVSVTRELLNRIVAVTSAGSRRPPVGLTSDKESVSPAGVVLHPVGDFRSPPHRVAARAWASRMACSARRRSGLTVRSGLPLADFDAPAQTNPDSLGSGLPAPAGEYRVWI